MAADGIVFDLDGTLLDASERMYQLFIRLAPQSGLTKNGYWELKRSGRSHYEILSSYCPEMSFREFQLDWMSLIETENYLDMDSLQPRVVESLTALATSSRLFLLTARRDERALMAELDKLGIRDSFEAVRATRGQLSKRELLARLVRERDVEPASSLAVGDTAADIEDGRALGFCTVAVCCGFQSRAILKESHPAHVFDSVSDMHPPFSLPVGAVR